MPSINKSLRSIGVVLSIGILMFLEGRTLYADTGVMPVNIPPLPPYHAPNKPITPEGVCGCSLTGGSMEIFGGGAWNESDRSKDIGGKKSHSTGGTSFEPTAGLIGGYDWRLAGNPHDWQLIAGGEVQFDWTEFDAGGQTQVGPTKFKHCYTGPIGTASYGGDGDLYTGLANFKLGLAYKCVEAYGFVGGGLTWIDEDDSGAMAYERVRERCCGCCDPYSIQSRSYSLGSASGLDLTLDYGGGIKWAITDHLFLDLRYVHEDIFGFGASDSARGGIGWRF